MHRWTLILLFLFLSSPGAARQRNSVPLLRPDSIRVVPDSLRKDSLAAKRDTAAAVSGIDTVVNYASADSIVYSFATKTMSMYKKGDIRYQKMELKSDRIDIDWNTSVMTAFSAADSARDTSKKTQSLPTMKDGGEEYHGKELGYNFKTKRGRISVADTKIDQGYYYGDQIKKIGQDVLFVADGRYTTCDKPDPDYFFFSPKMKVMPGDKVIAEPVYFYVADVPIFWLPLAVFPNKAGRRSGIIAPAIAEDALHGRLLRHLGYYWAMNDYMDINLTSDLYTRGSWALFSNYRYSLRDVLNGSLSGWYRKMISGENVDPEHAVDESYSLGIVHQQTINPTTRFDVNFAFASNNAYRNTLDLNQVLNQTVNSNATLSKFWEGTPNSMSLSVSRTQNLVDGSSSEVLPSIRFNHSQSYPFRFGKTSDQSNLAWYENIGVGYSAGYSNNLSKVGVTTSGLRVPVNGGDTLLSLKDYAFNRNQLLTQDVSMNIAPKLGYVTISPSISYHDERRFFNNEGPALSPDSTAIVNASGQGTTRSGTLSTGVAASTKIYGIVQPNLLGIAAIRHTLTPSLSLTYSKQVIGDNLAPKQMVMGFSMGNIFEMKTGNPASEADMKKIQLMNVGLGASYNFSADSLNLSPLGVTFRTGIGSLLDVGGNTSFDFYSQDPVRHQRINKFRIQNGEGLAQMTNVGLTLTTALSGEKTKGKSTPEEAESDSLRRLETHPRSGFYGLHQDDEPDFGIPWKLGLTFNYSENKVQPFTSRSASLRGNLDFNLTEAWKFQVNGGYDLVSKEVVVPQISVSRDLHCWIMNFEWVPTGFGRHYQFEIRLKAPQLRDIKVTKQGSAQGIY
jgi:lipopolysaccharide assembly outer membrane protein LptD (OstA)